MEEESQLEKDVKEDKKRQFDADLPPYNIHNREAAADHNLRYDRRSRVYRDVDGCPTRDRFGQPLG